jgi:hypothetical protein
MGSLRLRLFALWLMLAASGTATGFLLFEFYRQSANVQLGLAEQAAARGCREISDRYAFFCRLSRSSFGPYCRRNQARGHGGRSNGARERTGRGGRHLARKRRIDRLCLSHLRRHRTENRRSGGGTCNNQTGQCGSAAQWQARDYPSGLGTGSCLTGQQTIQQPPSP